jgi:hypothetical protein
MDLLWPNLRLSADRLCSLTIVLHNAASSFFLDCAPEESDLVGRKRNEAISRWFAKVRGRTESEVMS